MPSRIQLQSEIVRTGEKAYLFEAATDPAYLRKTVSGPSHAGFALRYGQDAFGTGFVLYGPDTEINRTMTSATSPSPSVISASGAHASFPGWLAFDGGGTGWWVSGGMPNWLQYDHGGPLTVTKYIVRAIWDGGTFISHFPDDWTFQGSDDGTTWTTLDTQTNRSLGNDSRAGTVDDYVAVMLPQPATYRYWRITVSQTPSGSVGIGELDLIYNEPLASFVTLAHWKGSAPEPFETKLCIDPDTRLLNVRDKDNVLLAASDVALTPDTWHYIEFGVDELRLDKETIATWTAPVFVDELNLGVVEPGSVKVYMDDILVSEGDTWHGPAYCHLLLPDTITLNEGWDGALSSLTDDDETYMSALSGQLRLGFTNLTEMGLPVIAVQPLNRLSVEEDQAGIAVRAGSSPIVEETLTPTPTWHNPILETNPGTGNAWTVADVNGLELTYEPVQAELN